MDRLNPARTTMRSTAKSRAGPGGRSGVLLRRHRPTAADAWAILSNGEGTDRPYPDISRTLVPAHAFENGCFNSDAKRCGREAVNANPWPPLWATASSAGHSPPPALHRLAICVSVGQ